MEQPDRIIGRWRLEMDDLNVALERLLQERARVSQRIARRKQRLGLPTLDRQRERDIVDALGSVRGPLDRADLTRVFRQVFRTTRAMLDRT